MVTVVKNPAGHKIIDQAVDAMVTDSSGDALLTFPYHGFATGDFIYITADIEDYSGFWYVTVIDANGFKISEYDGGPFVEYFQDADIQYYQTQEHVWSSIFLPIIYKLSNDRWPTNSVDTIQTISSFADDNGYTNLNLSGVLKATFHALEFVEISGSSDAELNGVWQIVEVVTTSDITINLPYASGLDLTGVSIQYYYNNYQVKVKIYGGLPTSHPWEAKKPFTEVAELSLTPDSDNIVTFSVSDYIKGKVAIKNNPTIGSFPLNLDAFTGFYIATSEDYDLSDNYSLATSEAPFTIDTFEGYAIAGKLPFKNTYSGDYSNYVYTSGSPAHWLTDFARLFAAEDLYFDISFIKNIRGDFWVIIDKYSSDYATQTETIIYTDQGIGVYRVPIEVSSTYDSYCVRIYTPGAAATAGAPVTTLDTLADWVNLILTSWTLGASPTISVNGNGGESGGYLAGEIITTAGFSYEFTTGIDIDMTGTPISKIDWFLLDAGFNVIDSVTFNYVGGGVKTETFTLISATAGKYLAVYVTNDTPFDTKNYTVVSAAYNAPAAPDDSVPAGTITEEICIDILQSCVDVENGDTPEEDFFRLLETGFFRLLEDGERRLLEH